LSFQSFDLSGSGSAYVPLVRAWGGGLRHEPVAKITFSCVVVARAK